MTDTNNIFPPPDACAVFSMMKPFNDQQSATPPIPMASTEPGEAEELRNRLLAAAMSVMGACNTYPSPWLAELQIPMPNSKAELDELNLPAQFFSGFVAPSSDATTSPSSDFPFSNPFLMFPPDLKGIGGPKCLPPIVNGNKDEDFCELCQKHFCNKYYLRKHKGDVHRISGERFSQIRKREVDSGELDDGDDPVEKSPYKTDWMHILPPSVAATQQLAESQLNRRTPMEGIHSILDLGETNAASEKEQVSLWTLKPEELGEKAAFIPPTVAFEPVSNPTFSSTVICKSANSGALDVFKSSMAAAKLADRVTCELCKKVLCNKYFLRTHKIKVHGLSPQEVGGKHTEKLQMEDGNQGLEAFCSPPPLPPPLSLMTPMPPSQFPAPLGSLPSWPPQQLPSTMPEMPKPPQAEVGKDPVLQLMAANALVTCPLCDKTIGPRLFLPTHLTSAHSLNPADPSFFVFILSARTLDINGESDASVVKVASSISSDRGSPTSAAFQFPNGSLMRLPSTASAEPIDRQQASIPQLTVPKSMNDQSIFPPLISMNDMGTGGSGFDRSVVTTASNTPLPPFPPPLGLLSSQPGLYPAPPAIQLPLTPTTPLTVINTTDTAATTATEWNPVHLVAKRALPNGSTGATPRKSPNQMRVLCDICNKWICNKYFLRTHKANKHGIRDKTRAMTSTSQAIKDTTKGMTPVPLDFSKPWKLQQYHHHHHHQQQQQPPLFISAVTSDFFSTGIGSGSRKEDASADHQPIMSRWLFTNPKPNPPISRSPCIPPASNDSTDFEDSCGDRGRPLNLSIKMSPQAQLGSEIKHGVEQFLSNFTITPTRRRPVKVRRRHLQLHKRAAHALIRAYKHLSAFRGTASITTSAQDEITINGDGRNGSRPWQNVCNICKVSFNEESQLKAHCYTENPQHCSQIPIPTPTDSFSTSTVNYSPSVNAITHNSTAQIRSDCPINEAGGWWARQQKWPISFA